MEFPRVACTWFLIFGSICTGYPSNYFWAHRHVFKQERLILMQRIRIYLILFLFTAVLTPTVFLWEFGYPLNLKQISQKPYVLPWLPSFHLIPEVLGFFFLAMLVTAAGVSCLDEHPETMMIIKYALFLSWFLFVLFVLTFQLLRWGSVQPALFFDLVCGLPLLLGYSLERKVFSHVETEVR